jgi:hypothetical protein
MNYKRERRENQIPARQIVDMKKEGDNCGFLSITPIRTKIILFRGYSPLWGDMIDRRKGI